MIPRYLGPVLVESIRKSSVIHHYRRKHPGKEIDLPPECGVEAVALDDRTLALPFSIFFLGRGG